jgi:hypothetical protein
VCGVSGMKYAHVIQNLRHCGIYFLQLQNVPFRNAGVLRYFCLLEHLSTQDASSAYIVVQNVLESQVFDTGVNEIYTVKCFHVMQFGVIFVVSVNTSQVINENVYYFVIQMAFKLSALKETEQIVN